MYAPRSNRKLPTIPRDSLEAWAKILDEFGKLSIIGLIALIRAGSDNYRIETVLLLLVTIVATLGTSLIIRRFIQNYY